MMDDLSVHHPNNPMMAGAVRIGAAGEQLYSNLYGKEMEMMRKMMNLDEPTGGGAGEMGGHHPMMKYGQPSMAGRNFGPNIPHSMLTEVEMKHLTAMSGGGYPGAGAGNRFAYPNQMSGGGYGFDNKMIGNKFDGLLRPCYNAGNGGRFPFNPSPVPTFGSPATQIPNNNFICDPPHFNNGGGGAGNKTPNCGVVIKQENNNLNCGGSLANSLISSDFHNNVPPIAGGGGGNNNDLISTGGVNSKCGDDLFGKSNTTGPANLLLSNSNANNNSHSINTTNSTLSNSNNNNSNTNNKNEPNTFSNLTRNVIDTSKVSNKTRQVHPHRGKCMDEDDDDLHAMEGGPGMGEDERKPSANLLDHDSNDEYTDL